MGFEILFVLLGTPDAPSMTLSVDKEPLNGKLAVVNAGQTIDLKCTSKAGNPLTFVALTKNGNYFGPQPKPLLNSHTFMVTKEDNGAFLGCKSENKNKWHSETWPVELKVLCKLACSNTLGRRLGLYSQFEASTQYFERVLNKVSKIINETY